MHHFWLIAHGIAGILALVTGLMTWRQRKAPGALYLAVFLFLLGCFFFATVGEALATTLRFKLYCLQVEYSAVALMAPAFTLFTIHYTRRQQRFGTLIYVLLFIPSVLSILFTWTNDLHHLMWTGVYLEDIEEGLPLVRPIYGPWFWILASYTSTLALISVGILSPEIPKVRRRLQWAFIFLLVGIFATLWGTALYMSHRVPLNPAPLSGVIVLGTLLYMLRYAGLFDVIPIARATVFENMGQGILTLDRKGLIIDANEAAHRILCAGDCRLIRRSVQEVLHKWPQLLEAVIQNREAFCELQLEADEGETRYIEARIMPLTYRGHPIGTLVVFNDVTQYKALQEDLQRTLEKERAEREYSQTLSEITLALTSHLSTERIFQQILIQVEKLVPYDSANIALVDGNSLYIAQWRGYDKFGPVDFLKALRFPLDIFVLAKRALAGGHPILVKDTQSHPDWVVVPETRWIRSSIIVPIRHQGRPLGILRLDSARPHAFTPQDVEKLLPLAHIAAIALVNAQLHEQAHQELAQRQEAEQALQRQLRHIQALFRFTENLAPLLEVDEIARTIVTHVQAYLDCQCVAVYLQKENARWTLRAHSFSPECGHIPDALHHRPHLPSPTPHEEHIALIVDGQPKGVIIVTPRRAKGLNAEERHLLVAIANQASLALSRAYTHAQLKRAEAKYRELFQNVPVGLYRIRPDGTILNANQALASILHCPDVDTLLQRSCQTFFVNQEDFQVLQEQLAVAEGPLVLELNLRCHDGQTIWVRNTSHVVRDERGEILYVDGFLEDITEDVRLREERQRFITRIQYQAEQMAALNDILFDITQEHDVTTLLEKITQKAVELLGGTGGGVYLTDPEHQRTRCVVSHNLQEDCTGVELHFGEGVAGLVAATGTPLIIPDYRTWPNRARAYEASHPFVSVIGAPMIWKEEVLGVVEVIHNRPNYFSRDHQNLLMLLARQAAVALRNARLLEQERKRQMELEALRQASLKVTSSLDLSEILETILDAVMSLVPADDARIFLYDGQELTFGAARQEEDAQEHPFAMPRSEGITYTVAQTGKPIIIPNVNKHPGYKSWQWSGAIASFPLKTASRTVGVMNVVYVTPHDFSEDEIHLLTLFADQAAIAIEHAELFAEKEQHTRNITVLQRILQALNASPLLEETFPQVSALLKEYTGAARISLALLNEAQRSFTIAATDETFPSQTSPRITMPVDACTASRDILAGRVHITLDLEQTEHSVGERRLLLAGYRARLNIPLRLKGRVLGSLNLSWKHPLEEPPHYIPLLQQVADALALAVERAQLLRSTQRQAEELASLYKTALVLGSTLELSQLWQKLYEEISQLMHPTSMGVFLHDPATETVEIAFVVRDDNPVSEYIGRRLPRDECGLTGWVVQHGESLLFRDIYTETLPASPCDMESRGHAFLSVPLHAGERVIGAITLQSVHVGAFREADRRFLEALAAQVAIAAENARAYAAEQRARQESEHLLEAAQALSSTLNLQDVFDRILTELQKVVPYDSASVQELQDNQLVIIGGRGFPNLEEIVGLSFDITKDTNPNRRVVQERRPIIYRNVMDHFEEFRKEPHAQANIHSWLGVPMLYGDELIGIITLDKREPGFYTPEHARIAQAFATQAAIAIENARLYQHIHSQAQQMQRILDTMPDGVYLLDPEKRILTTNPAGRAFLAPLGVQLHVPLTHLGDRHIDEILQPPERGMRHEIHGITETKRIFEGVAQPLGEGEPQGWVLVVRDVTQERAIQQRIQQQDRLAAIGQLAAGIAHDFNNILQGIIGFARFLARRKDIPEDVRQRLLLIAEQGERGAQLVQQILDFSRRSTPHRRPLDLATLVKETLYWFKESLPPSVETRVILGTGDYTVHADKTQLQQVLTNLILNARDAMPQGGILTIELDRVEYHSLAEIPLPELTPGPWVRLRISDTGKGIPENVLPHIFEPFFTTKGPDQGTGLGLAQVYGIIQQHEGYITVESQVERGTTFTVYLPALELPVSPSIVRDDQTEKGPARKYVLLHHLDDEVEERVESLLQDLGMEVLHAEKPEDVLRLYRSHREQVVALITELAPEEMRRTWEHVDPANAHVQLPTIIITEDEKLPHAYSNSPRTVWIRRTNLVRDLTALFGQE
ncbi:MAG: GAF domain-containing protein [Chloroflexi bacterium]|nr:GAF domain-containing protein [Chloroflexota bacterium]